MPLAPIQFRFVYEPDDDSSQLDAYDAGQALYGISRSISILTHYTIHRRVIKQGPALSGAKVVLLPPRSGSFEFLLQVWPVAVDLAQQIAPSIAANFLYDLTKLIYRRSAGLEEHVQTSEVAELLRTVPGDIDSLSDATDADVVRIHRPLERDVSELDIYGDSNHIGNFDRSTSEYACATTLTGYEEEFIGNVASFNSNTDAGRLWIDAEQRTVAFKRDQTLKQLPQAARQLLSWSLNEYVNRRQASIRLIGKALTNREGKLKVIFVTKVSVPERLAG